MQGLKGCNDAKLQSSSGWITYRMIRLLPASLGNAVPLTCSEAGLRDKDIDR